MPATPTLGQLLRDAAARAVQDANYAIPGTVVTYNPTTNTASVYPGVMDLLPDEENPDELLNVELPAIQNVRVVWPRARGIDLTPPISAPGLLPGDPVLLICSDRDISGWAATGVQSPPDDARHHDWSCGAFAIPGALHDRSLPYGTGPTDAAALASKVLLELTAIRAALNAFIAVYNVHGHTAAPTTPVLAATPATPALGVPTATTPIPVASNILKVST